MLKRNLLIPLPWLLTLLLWGPSALAELIVDTAWVRRYNGPGNSGDWAYAVAVDDSGSVCVTGESFGGYTTFNDYATIKYHPDGDTAWVRRYNGPGSARDVARAIAVDESGSVYVTGESWGGATGSDYATIKYRPDGDVVWVRRYSRVGNYDDGACAMTLDDVGNVYVAGYSFGSSANSDFATVKYDANGDTMWARIYDGPAGSYDSPAAIAVDASGNVHVTGQSLGTGTFDDYATVKYDPNGDTAWVRRFDGPANGDDIARALVLDDSGNVYVTGESEGDGTGLDCTTVRYYSSGDTAWVRTYSGAGNGDDCGYAITLDDSGNVYVTGFAYGSGSTYDYLIIKYYPDGDTAWVRTYNGPGYDTDISSALGSDHCNSVYVTGRSQADGTGYDYATVKYDAEGDELWTRRYDGPGGEYDYAYALAIDARFNVYVAGGSMGSGTVEEYATVKYIQIWRGDLNGDGIINVGDIVYIINYLYRNGTAPDLLEAGDCNCDGEVNLGDAVYLIGYLFKVGPPPDC